MIRLINNGFYPVLVIGIFSLSILNCTGQRETPEREAHPIIERTELPVFNSESENEDFYLPVVFHLNKDGSVGQLNLMASSGDADWDSVAIDSMMKWKFVVSPSDINGILVRKNIRVVLLPSEVMNLGVLIAKNEEEANLLHNRLRAGISFEQLVNQISDNMTVGKSGNYLENADTIDYPIHISQILIDLSVGDFSRPIELNGEYLIFKRYGDRLPL